MTTAIITACPICGCRHFVLGPNGRLSPDGLKPRCAECGSLERHRAYRTAFYALAPPRFADMSALQLSPDKVVDPAWFASHALSVFGTKSELDLQQIAQPDESYDVVVVNHVLEHVEDDRAAIAELDRVVRQDGFVFLSVPDPSRTPKTREYGRPRADKHGHWRIYGPDILERLRDTVPDGYVVVLHPTDPITGAPDTAYVLTRSATVAADVSSRLDAAGIDSIVHGPGNG